ncbi:Glyoxylate reductase 1 [Saitozyma sp. JCM 24511]|nr:Glyoxylate reductase 1 [Saitozyma sp. JCM 24511]
MPKVLICANPSFGVRWVKAEQKSKLGAVAQVLELESTTRDEFFKDCKGKYQGVVGIYHHNDSSAAVGTFNKEFINALPSSVRYIVHNGAGYDQIDVDACTARGIQVGHTPKAVDHATATTGSFLAISALRQFYRAEVNIRNGNWKRGLKPAHDPEDRVLGIIGMGGIGTIMARQLMAFGMSVIYHNRREIVPKPDFPCEYVPSLSDLLARSDVVSLNLPLNEHTRGIFGAEQFDQMRDGAVLVNTARGGVVDETAMIAALQSGKLASVGLDVYPDEPRVNPTLLAMDNVTLLPHVGTETSDTQRKMELLVLDNLISAVNGKGLINLVPEQQRNQNHHA